MQLMGLGQTVYGPQLPCCASAEAAANSALVGGTGASCNPDCIESEGSQLQRYLDRVASQVDALTHAQESGGTSTGTPWYVWAIGGVAAVIVVRSMSR